MRDEERAERLRRALKANMGRRKAQARARDAGGRDAAARDEDRRDGDQSAQTGGDEGRQDG